MKPETPLPWKDIPTEGEFLNYTLLPKDADYAIHACNAYPKLVEFIRSFSDNETINTRPVYIAKARELLKDLSELPCTERDLT